MGDMMGVIGDGRGKGEDESRPVKKVRVGVEGMVGRRRKKGMLGEGGKAGKAEDFEGILDKVIEVLDLVLIMTGAPGEGRNQWIHGTFEILERLLERTPYPWSHPESAEEGREKDASMAQRRRHSVRENDYPQQDQDELHLINEEMAGSEYTDTFPPSPSIFIPPINRPIPRLHNPEMEDFHRHLYAPRPLNTIERMSPSDPFSQDLGTFPIIITGAMEDWPARGARPWKSPGYLLKRTLGGRRRVPVEVGRDYTDLGWGQRIMGFGEFLEGIGGPKLGRALEYTREGKEVRGQEEGCKKEGDNKEKQGSRWFSEDERKVDTKPVLYLAQTPLFSQFPLLRHDLVVPDYCYIHPPPPSSSSPFFSRHSKGPVAEGKTPELEEPLINAWLGPGGTVSPLHVDPWHNLLAQVEGRKYVRLYLPGARVYQRGVERSKESEGKSDEEDGAGEGGVDMSNTSQVDIGLWEGWDEFPPDEGPTSQPDSDAEAQSSVLEEEGRRERGTKKCIDVQAYRARFPGFGEIVEHDEEEKVEGFTNGDKFATPGERERKCYVEAELEEGEMLYIPVGWWHYVRGLSTSFSVSFWWN